MATFSERLRELRQNKDITLDDMSKDTGLTKATLSRYENGHREPKIEVLETIAEYFNVTVDYLLGRTDIKNPYNDNMETKAYHNLDKSGLPDEAIQQIEEYIEFIKQKYNPDGTLKKK